MLLIVKSSFIFWLLYIWRTPTEKKGFEVKEM